MLFIACDHEQEENTEDFGLQTTEDIEAMEAAKSKLDFKFKIHRTTTDVLDFVNGGVPAGSATLWRGKNGIFLTFYSDALEPRHTYTIWWIIWNNPENCAVPGACNDPDFGNPVAVGVDVMYATGRVANRNGKAFFWAYLRENDDSGTINPLFGLPAAGGLLDSKKAEVHAVLRSHGPIIPGELAAQIGSYEGGCDDPFGIPPFTEIPDAPGECADIFAAIFPAP